MINLECTGTCPTCAESKNSDDDSEFYAFAEELNSNLYYLIAYDEVRMERNPKGCFISFLAMYSNAIHKS